MYYIILYYIILYYIIYIYTYTDGNIQLVTASSSKPQHLIYSQNAGDAGSPAPRLVLAGARGALQDLQTGVFRGDVVGCSKRVEMIMMMNRDYMEIS